MKDCTEKNGVWVSEKEFSVACAVLPLVSIDFVFIARKKVLLGRRRNSPARDFLFTPGGRIRKNEPIEHATRRVLNEELGFAQSVLDKKRFLGVWDHFYQDSAFSPDIGTHYVNLAYSIEIDISDLDHASLPLDQHSEWFWVGLEDIDLLNQTHQYAKVYVEIALKQAI